MHAKRQVLFVQGGGKGAHDEWDNKLVESLRRELGQEYEVHYPRMPNENEPSYATWKKALAKVLEPLATGAILVGHSLGGTILLKTLTERPSDQKFGALILLSAPFVGKGGWPADDVQFPADLGAQLPHGVPIHFFHGLADETAPPAHVDLYAHAVPQARIHRLSGRDHQLNNELKEVAAQISALESPRSGV